eukprot:snap_masked-scaffold_3-processed-gene-10.16-mRNA-1 protein AED:1.00 eAED:1.00 QI:0/0/0/0/1/1/2/0/66
MKIFLIKKANLSPGLVFDHGSRNESKYYTHGIRLFQGPSSEARLSHIEDIFFIIDLSLWLEPQKNI